MGSEYRRTLADNAPPEWTTAERLVAFEIADLVHHKTGKWFAKDHQTVLRRRTGLSWKRISEVLHQLRDQRKDEFRVVRGYDKNGDPMYSYRGAQTTYQLPERWRSLATISEKGCDPSAERVPQTRTPTPEESCTPEVLTSTTSAERAAQAPPPSSAHLGSSTAEQKIQWRPDKNHHKLAAELANKHGHYDIDAEAARFRDWAEKQRPKIQAERWPAAFTTFMRNYNPDQVARQREQVSDMWKQAGVTEHAPSGPDVTDDEITEPRAIAADYGLTQEQITLVVDDLIAQTPGYPHRQRLGMLTEGLDAHYEKQTTTTTPPHRTPRPDNVEDEIIPDQVGRQL